MPTRWPRSPWLTDRPWWAPLAMLGLLLLIWGLPLWSDSRYLIGLSSQVGIAVLACLSFFVLWHQAGLLSFGHAVYTGAGAYLCMHGLLAIGAHGGPVPVVVLPLLCGLGTALLAWALGWLCTRRPGTPFAMITLGIGELVWAAALMWPAWSGGEGGLSGNRAVGPQWAGLDLGQPAQLHLLIALHGLAGVGLVWLAGRTTWGRLINAVRDNPLRVASLGYDPQRLRRMAFVFAAFLAGVAGALAALHQEIVTPELFGVQRSGTLLLFALLGGATVLGPVLGGLMLVLATVVLSGWTPAWMLYTGLVFMLAVIALPQGLGGWWAAWTQDSATRRNIRWPGARAGGRALAAAAGGLGAVALIEMAYQWPQRDTLGTVRQLAGLPLDAAQPAHWAAAAALALGGLMMAWWLSRPAPAHQVAAP